MTDMFGHASKPIELRDYQLHGIELLRTAIRKGSRRPLLVAPTGCHAAGTKILMADGRLCAVEHICVGDAVMGPDSKRRTVTALHRGIDDMYRVVPVKGEPFVVNGDHVLALRVTNDGSKRAGKVDTVTVREWLSSNTTYKHTRKLFRVGVEFPYRSLPVHPYMLGVILGDGCIRAGAIVANPDEEIRVAMAPLAKAAGLEMHEFDRGDRCPTFSLVTDIGKPNHLIRHLKSMGLMGCDSYGKFVPWDYKICSTEQRLELLAGLMDTDGSLANGIYDFVSASRRLADDVVFLARSVGLAAYMSECTKKWQGGVGQYWRVCISGDVSRIPCRVERKKAAPRKQIKNPLVTGFHVELIGVGTYYGFECSDDHLYVMGDFTVTHNSGKTTWAADIIRSAVAKGGKALFLAPRRELVYQASARLRSAGIAHGVLMAQAEHLENFDAPVQVGSIDTLIARLFRQKAKLNLPDFSLILVDEAHLAITQRRNDLLAHWPNAMVIGLTATPVRKDGRALGLMFDELVQPTSVRELIDAGYLVKPRYFSLSKPDLARVRITAGDYNAADLEEAVNKSELVGDIVQHWMEHAGDRRTVVFCTSIKHSVAVCEAFLRQGVAAEHVDANTPNDEREAIFKRFTSGETQLLTNCFLASYGFDLPELSCVVLARPTKSLMLYLQMLGRGLRPAPGKDDCLVLDHAGCVHLHGFAEQDREWSLDGAYSYDDKQSGDSERNTREVKPIECPECHAVFSKTPVCPECGYRLKTIGQAIETLDGKLVEIGTGYEVKPKPAGNLKFYLELRGYAQERGYKSGWAGVNYKKLYNDWPPRAWEREEALLPSPATVRWVKSQIAEWRKTQDNRSTAA